MKYTYIKFSSKQRSFYITKSSRGPDPTTQRAGFGPRAVCLTPLRYALPVLRIHLIMYRNQQSARCFSKLQRKMFSPFQRYV